MPTTAVFGIGNVLVGDDAVGPTVIHHLTSLWDFPEEVIVEDLGTPSLDLAGRLGGIDVAIFVDAVSAQGEPGTIRVYTRDEILKHPPGLRISPHDPSLKETLLTSEFAGTGPREILLVGIIAGSTAAFGLTPAVSAAVPRAVEAVLAELSARGVHPERKSDGAIAPAWWERQPNA